ncbi:alpha/beta hydrolase [Zhihengliuella flava]|uniref:Carboxylesterase n=1 Tax=Zhihengliuella flava TaxID=1285193 RepID=A0A931D810_9MICC|nr:alpha/beta fold hydrolase [Zhihengliuella flava]MBG6083698.1 carboxylesterase [Zhihengliuella flava]
MDLPNDPLSPLAVSPSGARDAVVVLHGFTSSPASVRGWAEDLLSAGYAVELPLLPGHGTRWENLAATPWTAWRDAAVAAYDRLQRNHRRVFVCGLSMGGALALEVAAARQPAGLALANPALTFADPTAHLAPVLKYAVPTVAAIANDIARPGQDEHAYSRTPVAAVAQLGALFRHVRTVLPRVNAPLVAFRSTTDHVVPDSSLETLWKRVGTDPARRRVYYLEQSYHVATLDFDADRITTETLRFFANLSAPEIAGQPVSYS